MWELRQELQLSNGTDSGPTCIESFGAADEGSLGKLRRQSSKVWLTLWHLFCFNEWQVSLMTERPAIRSGVELRPAGGRFAETFGPKQSTFKL